MEKVMRTMKKIAMVLLSGMFVAACSPGMYSNGGWPETEGAGHSKASFGFSVARCDAYAAGHFNLADGDWTIPVEMSGHVINFGELGDLGDYCNFYARLEYVSANPDHPGDGLALVCFGNGNDTESAEVSGHVWVAVQSGPYEGYENYGPIYGNVQSHECES